MNGIIWTEQEKQFLIDNYAILSLQDCSKSINRTINAIYEKVKQLKLKKSHNGRILKDENFEYIKNQFINNHMTIKEVANEFKVNESSLREYCIKRNFKPTDFYTEDMFMRNKESKDGGIGHIITIYKRSSKNRNLSYELSKEEFTNLISSNCHYCNIEPKQIIKRKRYDIKYNGIDRMNNNVGYIKDNCVSCCGECNIMKGTMNYLNFINKIKQISNRFNKI